MKAFTTVLSVAEIHAARAFYEDLFGLELYQDYGRNLWPLKRRTWMDSSKSCGPIPTCKPWAGWWNIPGASG